MNNKTVSLACVALALAVIYAAFFIDWHNRYEIHIFHEKTRPGIRRRPQPPGITFHLDNAYPLTSVEVVAVEDARTNKYPHFLWHLVATNKPVPTTAFRYGGRIRGMMPSISNAAPEHLDPDTKYSLRIEAGRYKGQTTFDPPS